MAETTTGDTADRFEGRVKVFILAGDYRVAARLAAELRLHRDAWAFANSERDLCGHQRVLVLEETDTAREHRQYGAMMTMIESRPDRYHVSPISLDWIMGIDRRAHMKLDRPTEFRFVGAEVFRQVYQNAPTPATVQKPELEEDPRTPPGTMVAKDRRTGATLGVITNIGEG